VGPAVTLVEVGAAASDLGLTRAQLLDRLNKAQIPLVQISRLRYFNMYWLEKLLFIETSPGHYDFKIEDMPVPSPDDLKHGLTEEFVAAATTHYAATQEQLRARIRSLARGTK